MKKIICIIILGVLLINCGKSDSTDKVDFFLVDFPKVVEMKSEKLQISDVLLKINRLHVIDSFLVIYQKRKDILFSVFDLHSLKHLYSFGSKGNGPNEFNLAFSSTFKPVYGKGSVFAMGNKMNNVQYYKIKELLNNITTPYKIAKLPPKLNGFRAMAYIGDSIIYGSPYAGENIDLFRFNVDDKVLNNYVEYPKDYPLIDSETKREVYGCYMTAKPDNTKFARTYSNMGKIEIFDIDNKSSFVISYEGFPSLKDNLQLNKSSKNVEHRGDQRVFSWAITSNDKYIYVKVFNDRYDKIADSEGYNESFVPEVHVFDWDGNPITKLKLENYFNYYDVDNEGKYLYTSSVFEEDIIRRYDLSKTYSH